MNYTSIIEDVVAYGEDKLGRGANVTSAHITWNCDIKQNHDGFSMLIEVTNIVVKGTRDDDNGDMELFEHGFKPLGTYGSLQALNNRIAIKKLTVDIKENTVTLYK